MRKERSIVRRERAIVRTEREKAIVRPEREYTKRKGGMEGKREREKTKGCEKERKMDKERGGDGAWSTLVGKAREY